MLWWIILILGMNVICFKLSLAYCTPLLDLTEHLKPSIKPSVVQFIWSGVSNQVPYNSFEADYQTKCRTILETYVQLWSVIINNNMILWKYVDYNNKFVNNIGSIKSVNLILKRNERRKILVKYMKCYNQFDFFSKICVWRN